MKDQAYRELCDGEAVEASSANTAPDLIDDGEALMFRKSSAHIDYHLLLSHPKAQCLPTNFACSMATLHDGDVTLSSAPIRETVTYRP